MASVVISGDTSGAVTITAPAVAGTPTLTLPTTTGTLATLTTPSFGTTIGVGGATASASGSGISFPATQSASTDANTLDDYEEGTWTPILGSAGATSGQTYSNQDGRYVKVGQMVMATFDLRMANKGTLNSDILIGGLPFASRAGGYYGGGPITNWDALSTSWIYLTMRLQNNGTAVSLSGRATAGTSISALQPADIGNSTILMGTIMYQASA